jgi:hypothetical protein
MDGIDELGEVEFNPAAFSQWLTGGAAGRALDAPGADLLPDFAHVLFEVGSFVHGTPLFRTQMVPEYPERKSCADGADLTLRRRREVRISRSTD